MRSFVKETKNPFLRNMRGKRVSRTNGVLGGYMSELPTIRLLDEEFEIR